MSTVFDFDKYRMVQRASHFNLDEITIINLYKLLECRKKYCEVITPYISGDHQALIDDSINYLNNQIKQLLAIY